MATWVVTRIWVVEGADLDVGEVFGRGGAGEVAGSLIRHFSGGARDVDAMIVERVVSARALLVEKPKEFRDEVVIEV